MMNYSSKSIKQLLHFLLDNFFSSDDDDDNWTSTYAMVDFINEMSDTMSISRRNSTSSGLLIPPHPVSNCYYLLLCYQHDKVCYKSQYSL